MDCKVYFIGIVILLGVIATLASLEDYIGEDSIGKREEYLDANEQYLVEWEAYLDTKTVIFELTVATTGFVGFGISPAGGMTGADIIIAGVHPNGTVYFGNYHGVGNQAPDVDDNETWELIEATENTTHTHLKVGRSWNSCDLQDVAIENSTNHFIWSLGQSDNIGYHGNNRGTSTNIILDPPMPPVNTTEFQFWKITHTMEMPGKDATYWCTVHKSPPLSTKHHIVGFRPILDTSEALRHMHHFIVHICRAPQGSTDEETFERFIGQGGECYSGSPNVPMEHCESYLFVWAKGGKTVVYPDHVGYPFAVDGTSTYYMLEVHLDNPNKLQRVIVETGVEILYTPKLRQYDAGILTTGQTTSYTITIPPRSVAHMIVGHCSPTCTNSIPETGVNVFQVLLHSHVAGRKLKLRHYRDGYELPWISSDDNYDFNFQQNRQLLEEVKLLPGDQLTYECTYNTMNANGTVVGGLSTSDEMCNTFLVYYPEMELHTCRTISIMTDLLTEFGIEDLEAGQFTMNPIITAPQSMANKTYTEILDTMVPWTEEFRSRIQYLMRYGDQAVFCGMRETSYLNYTDLIKYYDASKEYAELDECENRENSETPELPGGDNKQTVIHSSLYLIECLFAMVTLKLWI